MSSDAEKPVLHAPAAGRLPPYYSSADRRFVLYQGDCLHLMPLLPPETFDMVFADPPYFLSNGGITCHAGRMVSVNKGKWDRSLGFRGNYEFTRNWLAACRPLLKPHGTIWISGTSHIIHLVGCALDELGYKILNDVTWVKPNPPPNLSCRYFTHATETILWAARDKHARHKFHYPLMKRLNGGKQMTSVWSIDAPRPDEKIFGKHPTQKPLALLERIIAASTDENDAILDPFSGAASTGIAAARLSRGFCGLEIDSSYLDLALLRFEGVPQADNPETILCMVRLHHRAARSPAELAEALCLTERQVHYYRQAAFLAGLLVKNAAAWSLTHAGRAVCIGNEKNARTLLARQFHNMPLVRRALRLAGKACNPDRLRRAVAQMLARCTSLGETTCMRRASTLLSWAAWASLHAPLDGLIEP